jgi:hypothetical protein
VDINTLAAVSRSGTGRRHPGLSNIGLATCPPTSTQHPPFPTPFSSNDAKPSSGQLDPVNVLGEALVAALHEYVLDLLARL